MVGGDCNLHVRGIASCSRVRSSVKPPAIALEIRLVLALWLLRRTTDVFREVVWACRFFLMAPFYDHLVLQGRSSQLRRSVVFRTSACVSPASTHDHLSTQNSPGFASTLVKRGARFFGGQYQPVKNKTQIRSLNHTITRNHTIKQHNKTHNKTTYHKNA